MTPMPIFRLTLGAVLLLGAGAASVGAGAAVAAGSPGRSDEGSSPVLNPMRALDTSSFKSFVDRPLFDPARSLPPPVAEVAVAPPVAAVVETPPNVHLLGIIQGTINLAVVRLDNDPKTQMVSTGDHLGNWDVTVLPTGALRLRNGSRVVDYALFDKGGAMPQTSAPVGIAEAPVDFTTVDTRTARLQGRTY